MASIPKRIAIVAAGGVVNIIFGLLIYFIMIASAGNFYSTTVDYVLDDYAAKKYGIVSGDKIVKINDKKVSTKSDITDSLEKCNGEEISVTLIRNEQEMTIKLLPTLIESKDIGKATYYLGVSFEKTENTFANNIYYGLIDTKEFSLSIIDNVKQLFTGNVSVNQMTGIVGISDIVVSTEGFNEYIYILALISLSLGVTNLLPMPPLDGGKILIYIIEAVRRKTIKEETELKIQTLGFSILITLTIYVTYNDILRIF